MYAIDEFCKKRGIDKKIKDAFVAYCKASIASSYNIGSGETITGLLLKHREEEVKARWVDFVKDLKRHLEEEDHEDHNSE